MASKIRKRIVANAVRCFARRGYSGCSTKEIAARANVTEGSLFRLFISKEKLFSEALSLVLASQKNSRMNRRFVAFALLENKGMNDHNVKALRRFSAICPFVREFQSICK
jgi:AcrR family transcriptional regulator